MDIVENIVQYSTELISTGGYFFGFFLVFLECFIPALPLSVFVALNVNAFGLFLGVFISWIATCTGSFICYLLFSYMEEKLVKKMLNKKFIKNIKSKVDRFQTISFSQLVFIITLPFTPSFLINILSGVSGMKKEKFMMAIIIGKLFMILFWGYVGKSIITNLTDVKSLLLIIVTLIVSYSISKIVSKKMNIE